jgi:hypothetical protein
MFDVDGSRVVASLSALDDDDCHLDKQQKHPRQWRADPTRYKVCRKAAKSRRSWSVKPMLNR